MSSTDYNTVFAWNAGAGVSYAFTDAISADLAYRYVGLGYYQAEFKDERDANGQPFGMTHAKGAMGTVGANFNITERWFTRAMRRERPAEVAAPARAQHRPWRRVATEQPAHEPA